MNGESKAIVPTHRHDLVVISAEIHQAMADGYADPYPAFEVRMPLPGFVDSAELSHALAKAVTKTVKRPWWQRLPGLWRGSR